MRERINFSSPPWAERRRVLITERDRLNYANFIPRMTELYGDRTAFLIDHPISYPGFEGDVVSYRDMNRLVSRMAGALRALGVSQGDRVGLITMNRVEMAFCNFACARIGALPVPMNFMLRPNEIEHIVDKAGIEVLVCDPDVFHGTITEPSAVPNVKTWVMIDCDDAPAGIVSMRHVMADQPDHVEPVEPSSPKDTALLFFTSGTTGFPKGAMLSHAATMVHVQADAKKGALRPKQPDWIALAVMPVAHAAGYAMMLLNLAIGNVTYFLSKFEPQAIFEAVERVRPAIFSGTPAMFRMLLDAGAAKVDWSSIRIFGGGADAFDDDLVHRVRLLAARRGPLSTRRLPWFIRGYGMAEANSFVAQSVPFEAGDNCCGWVRKPVEYRLVDEDGNDVAKGEPGELLIRGPNVTTGYWNDPEATAQAISDGGWFHTGDVMRKGKWGMLYFVGRSGDIIKSGGYKISANEIDQALCKHPDVSASATVGIPHEVKGERPVSAVVLRPGATSTPEDILAWARERIAAYKCPRAIVPVPEIPMTFSMKPKRIEIREQLRRELA